MSDSSFVVIVPVDDGWFVQSVEDELELNSALCQVCVRDACVIARGRGLQVGCILQDTATEYLSVQVWHVMTHHASDASVEHRVTKRRVEVQRGRIGAPT
jgi:hypothetical protein